MKTFDIKISDSVFIRVCEGRKGDVEQRIWRRDGNGLVTSTGAGLYCPYSKIDDLVRAILELKREGMEARGR